MLRSIIRIIIREVLSKKEQDEIDHALDIISASGGGSINALQKMRLDYLSSKETSKAKMKSGHVKFWNHNKPSLSFTYTSSNVIGNTLFHYGTIHFNGDKYNGAIYCGLQGEYLKMYAFGKSGGGSLCDDIGIWRQDLDDFFMSTICPQLVP